MESSSAVHVLMSQNSNPDWSVSEINSFPSTGGSNIISLSSDESGGIFECLEFNGTLQQSNISPRGFQDVMLSFSNTTNSFDIVLDSTGDVYCEEVLLLSSGHLAVVGSFSGTSNVLNYSTTNPSGYLYILSPDFETNKSFIFDTGGDDKFYGLTELSSGGIVVAGSSEGNLSNYLPVNVSNCSSQSTCGIIIFLSPTVIFEKLQFVESNQSVTCIDAVEVASTNQVLVTGYFSGTMSFNNSLITSNSSLGSSDLFISKLDQNRNWVSLNTIGSSGSFRPKDIIFHQNSVLLLAEGVASVSNPAIVSPSGTSYSEGLGLRDIVILKVNNLGIINSLFTIGSNDTDGAGEFDILSDSELVITGFIGTNYSLNHIDMGTEERNNFFVSIYNLTTDEVVFAFVSDGSEQTNARANAVAKVSENVFVVAGRLNPFHTTILNNSFPGSIKTGISVLFEIDSDSDGLVDSLDNCDSIYNPLQKNLDEDEFGDECDEDIDSDGYLNEDDNCNRSPMSPRLSDRDSDGCYDFEDEDIDGDGIANENDSCGSKESITKFTESDDRDRDGCHDSLPLEHGEDEDDDGDLIFDWKDNCTSSTSVLYDQNTWLDFDLDGCHDSIPGMYGEDLNDDNDGFTDEIDDCANIFGDSSLGELGCLDGDGDGWSDSTDSCPMVHGTSRSDIWFGCLDSDNDSYADLIDSFDNDYSQWNDSDGDGFGDNYFGNQSDNCPNEYGKSINFLRGCLDSDGDGWADLGDDLPLNPTIWLDSDDDGFGENLGSIPMDFCPLVYGESTKSSSGCLDSDLDGWADEEDSFPNLPSQWSDIDGDGFGDEIDGYMGDECSEIEGTSFIDRIGCLDLDGDGYSNSDLSWSGEQGSDLFPNDSTQWNDTDGDGFGDNPLPAKRGDHCPEVTGTSINLEHYGCNDSDGDGYWDEDDYCKGPEKCFTAVLEGRAVLIDIAIELVALSLIILTVIYIYKTEKGRN